MDAPRRGGSGLAVRAVDAGAVDAVAVEVDTPRRGGTGLAVLAVDAVAVELDARLDGAVLAVDAVAVELGPMPWPFRCSGGRAPRRGGAALAVLAVDVVPSGKASAICQITPRS